MSLEALFSRRRLARISVFAAAQVVVQAIAFASGLILLRHMEIAEYGYYTLATSMIGFANVLLDLGLAGAVIASGGPHHREPRQLANLVADAKALSTKFLLCGAPLLAVGYLLVFLKQGADSLTSVALTVLAIGCACINTRSTLLLSITRIQGNLKLQQRIDIFLNFSRLMLVISLSLVLINAALAVLVNFLTALSMWITLRRHVAGNLGAIDKPTHGYDRQLVQFVRRQAPNSVYFCFVGQITVWIMSLTGSTEQVAALGALGRLAVIFGILGVVITAVVQPYFARGLTRREFLTGFNVVNLSFLIITSLVTVLALNSPHVLLWILGPNYSRLGPAVAWTVLSACISAWAGALYSIGAAKGWLVPFWVVVPIGLGTTALTSLLVDVSSVVGCLTINCAVAFAGFGMTFVLVAKNLAGWRK